MIRGGLVGAVVGGFYPIFLAIPLNGSLAARYVLQTCSVLIEMYLWVKYSVLSVNSVDT